MVRSIAAPIHIIFGLLKAKLILLIGRLKFCSPYNTAMHHHPLFISQLFSLPFCRSALTSCAGWGLDVLSAECDCFVSSDALAGPNAICFDPLLCAHCGDAPSGSALP